MSDAIQFREIKMEGGWLMVKPERQELGKAMALVRRHKQRLYDLDIKEHREKRSLDANAYAWVLIHKLAEAMRITPEEVYLQAILGIGGNCTPVCVREKDVERFKRNWQSNGLGWPVMDLGESQVAGCRNLMAYHGSSTYDTAQMSRLIDVIVYDCKSHGIETMPPGKLAALMEGWECGR